MKRIKEYYLNNKENIWWIIIFVVGFILYWKLGCGNGAEHSDEIWKGHY